MAYNENMEFKLEVKKHPSFIQRPKNVQFHTVADVYM